MVEQTRVKERALLTYLLVGEDGQEIAELRQMMSRSDADAFAKGRPDKELRRKASAMAAGPAVLAALEEAVRLYEQSQFKTDSTTCGEWANKARDAIAIAYLPIK